MKKAFRAVGIAVAAVVVAAFVILALIILAFIIATKGKPFWTWEGGSWPATPVRCKRLKSR